MSAEPPKPPRRNPRAERAARIARPAEPQQEPAAEPLRPRRDPRAERGRRSAPTAPDAAPAPAAEPVVTLPDTAKLLFVLLDLDSGGLGRSDRELLGAGRRLADALGAALVGVTCLADAAGIRFDPAAMGLDRVLWLADPAFAEPLMARRSAAVAAACTSYDPVHVLFSETAEGGELGRRTAARLRERAAAHVVRIGGGLATSVADAGRTDLFRALPRFVFLRPDSFEPIGDGPRREAKPLPPPHFSTDDGLADRGLLPVDPASLPLGEAELIVGAGYGVSDWPSFHALALALGAAEGGSRVVCDSGALPRDRQIGASGNIVAPRCYIALGISGASQHLDGITTVPRVVAVNADPHADMLKRADLAIVADVQAVMPALLRQLEGTR